LYQHQAIFVDYSSGWNLNFTGLHFDGLILNPSATTYIATVNTSGSPLMVVDDVVWTTLSANFEALGYDCSSGNLCGSMQNCSSLKDYDSYLQLLLDDTAYIIPF